MVILKIILISGKAGSGKDTVAREIQKSFWGDGKRVAVTHFADPLKEICKRDYGWNGIKDEEGRKLLQYVGTEVYRAKDPDYWVKLTAETIKKKWYAYDYVLIPDLRFVNEISVLKSMGFDVVHIHVLRDDYKSELTEEQKNHPSETSMDGYPVNYIVSNHGNMVDLILEVYKLCRNLRIEYRER